MVGVHVHQLLLCFPGYKSLTQVSMVSAVWYVTGMATVLPGFCWPTALIKSCMTMHTYAKQ